ncbi:MAG: PH domain-containing protein [Rikenellaceae bacterium]|nr:PH domain-containing protein [Rikenellaceae bacterium]
MKKDFKYRLNRKSKRLTVIFLLVSFVLILLCNYYSFSGFLPAWVISLLVTTAALYILSIPKYVRVTDSTLEIHCMIELTNIPLQNIKNIRQIDKKDMKYTAPLLGSYGFFGFYGYFYDFSKMSFVKMYASAWENFIMIEDIYEDTYIINCSEPAELVKLVEKNRESLVAAIAEAKASEEASPAF